MLKKLLLTVSLIGLTSGGALAYTISEQAPTTPGVLITSENTSNLEQTEESVEIESAVFIPTPTPEPTPEPVVKPVVTPEPTPEPSIAPEPTEEEKLALCREKWDEISKKIYEQVVVIDNEYKPLLSELNSIDKNRCSELSPEDCQKLLDNRAQDNARISEEYSKKRQELAYQREKQSSEIKDQIGCSFE